MLIKDKKLNTLKVFFNKKMLKIYLLGIISGFPWVLIGSCLSLWLKEEGLSRSTIGWSGLIFAVYAFNYAWAPLIDKLKIPILTDNLGHRKSWIFLMQTLIIVCLLFWGIVNPKESLFFVIAIGLMIAIFSSTQDIVIDALRIEQIRSNDNQLMAAGASIAVVGWWSGYKIGGLIALSSSQFIQNLGFFNYWQLNFVFLTFIIFLLNFFLLTIKEGNFDLKRNSQNQMMEKFNSKINFKNKKYPYFISWIISTFVGPIISFFKNNSFSIGIAILAFIFSFKIGEAFLGRMSVIFYKEIGFSKTDIGIYSKGIGWLTTITFTLIGGIFTIRSGIVKAVFIAGVFMSLTNLLFALLAWTGKNYLIFLIAVVLDDITSAFATVAFVALISVLVDRNYTATQYALLASIGTAGRTIFSSSSGTLVDYLNGNWQFFFIITSIMVIPSLLILYFIKDKIKTN
tara:strand:+ start:798 stop:2165 length:1368 start_codon:yes stop_codon:yes gene_type:complete